MLDLGYDLLPPILAGIYGTCVGFGVIPPPGRRTDPIEVARRTVFFKSCGLLLLGFGIGGLVLRLVTQ